MAEVSYMYCDIKFSKLKFERGDLFLKLSQNCYKQLTPRADLGLWFGEFMNASCFQN